MRLNTVANLKPFMKQLFSGILFRQNGWNIQEPSLLACWLTAFSGHRLMATLAELLLRTNRQSCKWWEKSTGMAFDGNDAKSKMKRPPYVARRWTLLMSAASQAGSVRESSTLDSPTSHTLTFEWSRVPEPGGIPSSGKYRVSDGGKIWGQASLNCFLL